MKTVLVVGGAGYVGSHAAKSLKMAGFTPVVYDNLSRGHQQSVKWGPFQEGDIQDVESLVLTIREYNPVAVMHFAALAYVGESVRYPADYYHINVTGTLALLEAMRITNTRNLIFSSTCATYGIPSILPITEEAPQVPVNPYGRSKLMVEQILKDFDAAYGLPHVCLRYFNAAGADPFCEIGEAHAPETHLIPLAIEAAMGRGQGLTIFGNDYDTPDGTCIRDYIHVWDLALAHVQALHYLLNGGMSDAFNLGNGHGYSNMQVIAEVQKHSKLPIRIHYDSRRPGDPPILVGSGAKAKIFLGWTPKMSDLPSIVETAWNWHEKTNAIP